MKLRWLPAAADDLQEIHDFLHVYSPRAAHRTVKEIFDAILTLRRYPYIGRPNTERGTRELILPRIRYKVTYRIREEAIEVLYIRHGSRGPQLN
jgi:plasmid stabilization system protein ParE